MTILIDQHSVVLVQGITGRIGSWHAKLMREYGTNVVAGVTPGKGGASVADIPVYDTVREATEHFPINVSIIFAPPSRVKEAACEAIDASIPIVVSVTEHVPVFDALYLRDYARERGCTVIGPNTVGLISPGQCKVGIMPGAFYRPGKVGLISRSGTLTHETAIQLSARNVGQSTCIGIGGDSVNGTDYADLLELFRRDDGTDCVIMVGEIGGWLEQRAAETIDRSKYPKPVYAFLAGRRAPHGRRMGHAGALVSDADASIETKERLLREAGVNVFQTIEDLTASVAEYMRVGKS